MTINVGPFDRGVRAALGIVLIASAAFLPVTGHWVWALLPMIGFIPLLSGFTGMCPLYLLANVNTTGGDAGVGAEHHPAR